MPNDSELDLCGKLIRGLGSLREMLPGSFIERSRKCGKPNCRCAEGTQLHQKLLLSVVWHKRIGPISVVYPRLRHAGRDIDSLFALGCTIAQRLNRNGVLGSELAMDACSPPSMASRSAVPTRAAVTSPWTDKLKVRWTANSASVSSITSTSLPSRSSGVGCWLVSRVSNRYSAEWTTRKAGRLRGREFWRVDMDASLGRAG